MGREIYSRRRLWSGFRTCPLIRFVSEEQSYLSNTHGGPRMYVNMVRGAAPMAAAAIAPAAPMPVT